MVNIEHQLFETNSISNKLYVKQDQVDESAITTEDAFSLLTTDELDNLLANELSHENLALLDDQCVFQTENPVVATIASPLQLQLVMPMSPKGQGITEADNTILFGQRKHNPDLVSSTTSKPGINSIKYVQNLY